jgi:hypothetical protein
MWRRQTAISLSRMAEFLSCQGTEGKSRWHGHRSVIGVVFAGCLDDGEAALTG